jgi:hypothetical protein
MASVVSVASSSLLESRTGRDEDITPFPRNGAGRLRGRCRRGLRLSQEYPAILHGSAVLELSGYSGSAPSRADETPLDVSIITLSLSLVKPWHRAKTVPVYRAEEEERNGKAYLPSGGAEI